VFGRNPRRRQVDLDASRTFGRIRLTSLGRRRDVGSNAIPGMCDQWSTDCRRPFAAAVPTLRGFDPVLPVANVAVNGR
jgi:hypothetical protein